MLKRRLEMAEVVENGGSRADAREKLSRADYRERSLKSMVLEALYPGYMLEGGGMRKYDLDASRADV